MAAEVVDVVIAALTAGAADGVKDATSTAVKSAYGSLLAALRGQFGRVKAQELQMLVQTHIDDHDGGREHLVDALGGVEITADDDLVEAARDFLSRLDLEVPQAGKYTVDASNAQGVQVGDRNTMTLSLDGHDHG
jgi:hypothetical protein